MGYNSNHSTSKATRERQRTERLGEERLNNQGYLMKVVEYEKTESIVVEFQDKYKGRVVTRYNEFAKGKVKNPYQPNIYGGMIGVKYPAKVNGKISKEYYIWKNMLVKCGKTQGWTCCKEWKLFENFYEWLHKQENVNKFLNGKQWVLCKDIVENNIYSPNTCYLVPPKVSKLFEIQELNVDSVSERVLKEYTEHKEKIIKRIAQEEFLNKNITEQCYKAMMDYKVNIVN